MWSQYFYYYSDKLEVISIYNYLEPANYLKDRLAILKDEIPGFSLRAWSKHLGMKSHGPLHAILNKQRRIPKKLVPIFIKTLKLDKQELRYFEILVDFQRSKTPQEKEFYLDRLRQLSPKPLREINDLEAYKYITDPIHIILAELTQLKSFKDDPVWIKQHFRLNQNLRDIENIINRLKSLGVIEAAGKKMLKPVKHKYTKFEIESADIQNYHKTCSKMAIDQISKQNVEEKEFNAIAFNIKKKDLPKMKEQIREFINTLVDNYEAGAHQGDETYQLNLQLFSLSK